MRRSGSFSILVVVLSVLCLLATTVSADVVQPKILGSRTFGEVAKIIGSNSDDYDELGFSAAVDGNAAVVGAWKAEGAVALSGAAYVLRRNHGGAEAWGEVALLAAADGDVYDLFGGAVAIDGDTVVVGAPSADGVSTDTGAVYIFERNVGGADAWGQVAKLVAADGVTLDSFGGSVAIDGDIIVVGARDHTAAATRSGAAYVFRRNQGGAGAWGQLVKLTASDASSDNAFGHSVAISADTVVVGANQDTSAYVFERNAGGADAWGEVRVLTGSDLAHRSFGVSIAIDGDTLVVGGHSSLEPGAAWVFERNAGGADMWGEVQRLGASDASVMDFFGATVAISGGAVLVGASRSDAAAADAGAAYLFERNAGGADAWGEMQRITASDPADEDFYGSAVALDGGTAVVGAVRDDGAGPSSGAAYVLAPCGGDAGEWSETTEILNPDAADYDGFGNAVDVSDEILAVGVQEDDNGGGSVYLFGRNQGGADVWGQVGRLTGSDVGTFPWLWFGCSVGISGDTVVVGASARDSYTGAAYLFTRNHGGPDAWGEVTKLTRAVSQSDWYGGAVALDGDVAVVGAHRHTGTLAQEGAAYVFGRNSGGPDSWGLVTPLAPSVPSNYGKFGTSIAVDGDLIVVGAPDTHSVNEGSVYVFARNQGGPGAWGEVARVTASDGDPLDVFGTSVALSGGTLVVGAPYDDTVNGMNTGSVYVFERNHGGADAWGEVAMLTAPGGAVGDEFGHALSFDGSTLLVGVPAISPRGAVYVFGRNHGGPDAWGYVETVAPTDLSGQFGYDVAVAGGLALVGANRDSDVSYWGGSAYLFENGCVAMDLGDAPDPTYPTLLVSDGARHRLGSAVFLGATVDADIDGQPSPDASGDDTDFEGDDEDGVVFPSPLVPGGLGQVEVQASAACLLNAWIDFNADGDWDDPGEQVFTDEPLTSGTNLLDIFVPADAVPGAQTFARFRVDSGGGLVTTGMAADGEVEDHGVEIVVLADLGISKDDGVAAVVPGGEVTYTIVAENAGPNDAAGATVSDVFSAVASCTWTCVAAGGASCTAGPVSGDIADTVDLPVGGTTTYTAVCAIDHTASGSLTNTATVDPPMGATDPDLADNTATDVDVLLELDYGDAPDPGYPTVWASDGARHVLGGGLVLGVSADAEGDGQPTSGADGDDLAGTDDEDGVVLPSSVLAGAEAQVQVTASAAGLLDAWVDLDGDGDWLDAGEQLFTSEPLAAGVNDLSFVVPLDAAPGTAFARFRLSSAGGLAPDGLAADGEVEDHAFVVEPSAELEIVIGDWPDPVPENDELHLEVTARNNGQLDATGVVLTTTLPPEVTFVSVDPGLPTCSESAGIVTCDLGTVASGVSTQVAILVALPDGTIGALTTTADGVLDQPDPVPGNTTNTENTTAVDDGAYVDSDNFDDGTTDGWDAVVGAVP